MDRKIILILLILGIQFQCIAYPISPRPLRLLVQESQFIIVGYVVKTENNTRPNSQFADKIATISVLENLQGQLENNIIEIEFEPNLICPAPAIYHDSTYVIAFLDKNNDRYKTHALSYGIKTLEKKDIEIYKNRILEIQNILKISNLNLQKTEVTEWLIKCAENSATCWEGTYELNSESYFMSDYSSNKLNEYKHLISIKQKERLKYAVLKSQKIEIGLIDLVYIGNEKEINQYLISNLKEIKESEYWQVENYMKVLSRKKHSFRIKRIIKKSNELNYDDNYNKELKKIIDKFVKLIEK